MGNLKKMDLVELDNIEVESTEGGLILLNPSALAETFHWAYTEFKKGLDDGYNGR